MCTIVVLNQVHPGFPLVVAANRDEFHHRAWDPPDVLDDRHGVVGGRDREKGGTWMGVTRRGFFVGVTNQRTFGRPMPGLRSRGAVVLDALRAGTTLGVTGLLRALDPAAYNPFNLVYGDVETQAVAYARPEGITVEPLPPGLHVLANDRIGSPHFPKTQRAVDLTSANVTVPWEVLFPVLTRALADHQIPPDAAIPPAPPGSLMPRALIRQLQALCVHTPLYGTVSSTILALPRAGGVGRYCFAPGRPCTTPWQDVTALATG